MEPGGEGGWGGGDGGGLAGEVSEFGEAVGCGERGGADGGLDCLGKFGGVGGGEDENGVGGVGGAAFCGGEAADGGVGIDNDVGFAVDAPDGFEGGGVVEGVAVDGFADGGFVVLKEVADAFEVIGGSDVHGIGEGGHGRARLVGGACEEAWDGVVAVGGGDPFVDRDAEALGEEAGGEVAKVAAGHDEDRRKAGVSGGQRCL